MVLIYWWIWLLWLGLIAVLFVLYRKGLLKKWLPRPKSRAVKVAHSDRITALPEYKVRKKAYSRLLSVFLAISLIGLLSAMILSSRPAAQSLVTPAQTNRDILLCLDISGSMTSVDVELVETFQQLARDFKGQRIGLDMFNYNSSQVFPLTDDYDLINEQLAYANKMLPIGEKLMGYLDGINSGVSDDEETEYYNYTAGTSSTGLSSYNGGENGWAPSSNVGIGLAGCAQHLGENLSGRSQSIILASDNELGGTEESAIITTKQAMMLAKQKGIRVYAIDPGVYDSFSNASDADVADNYADEHAVLRTYALATGGGYYRLSSTDIVSDVISKISAQEAKLFTGDSQYAASDAPLPMFIALFVAVLGTALLSWRLKL